MTLAERVQGHEGLERKDEKTKDEQHRVEDEQRSRVLLPVLRVEACFEPAKYFRGLILAIHDPLVILSIPPPFPSQVILPDITIHTSALAAVSLFAATAQHVPRNEHVKSCTFCDGDIKTIAASCNVRMQFEIR